MMNAFHTFRVSYSLSTDAPTLFRNTSLNSIMSFKARTIDRPLNSFFGLPSGTSESFSVETSKRKQIRGVSESVLGNEEPSCYSCEDIRQDQLNYSSISQSEKQKWRSRTKIRKITKIHSFNFLFTIELDKWNIQFIFNSIFMYICQNYLAKIYWMNWYTHLYLLQYYYHSPSFQIKKESSLILSRHIDLIYSSDCYFLLFPFPLWKVASFVEKRVLC